MGEELRTNTAVSATNEEGKTFTIRKVNRGYVLTHTNPRSHQGTGLGSISLYQPPSEYVFENSADLSAFLEKEL